MVRGLPCLDHVEQFCDVCVLTKQRRLPFPQQASFRAKERLELVHGDLCGLMTPAIPGGRRYFLLLVDDLSRYMWVMVLGSKGEAADAIRRTQAAVEAECGRKLRVLRTDNGGEFTTAEFASYCAVEGIQRHYSAPYSSRQNDIVERRNQMVVGMTRALLKQRGMPAILWGEAVVAAVYILNRSPTKALDDKTPYEAWHGRKLAVSHLRVFGCLAFAKELGHIGKLDNRSTPGVFIGYTEGLNAYRILDPETQCVRTARDVVFDEGRGWVWDKAVDDGSTPTYDDFTIEYVHFEGAGGVGSSSSPSVPTPVPEPPPTPTPATPTAPRSPAVTSAATRFSPTPPQPATPRTPAPTATPPGTSTPTPALIEHSPVEFATPLSHDEEHIDAYHDGEQLRYHTMEDLPGNQPVLGLVPHDLEAQLHLACDDGEPRSFVEAERHEAWRVTMQSEMDAVEKNRTWELADLPRGHRVITLKWDNSGITLRQTAYAKRVVELAGLTDCNLALTPMEERLKLSRDSTTEEVDATQHRRLVGSLRYLAHTRPDLAFSVGYVSRFMQRPTMEHQQTVMRIVRYVARTLDHGLFYPRCPRVAHFIGYSDNDHTGDIDTIKDSGYCWSLAVKDSGVAAAV
ncbi:uncharacterized protein [Setaria viridis]|uniref:uncharacterized protein n=1 Tax=Setaria viridis TaxID=4556 RepID=UPI003B3BD1D6